MSLKLINAASSGTFDLMLPGVKSSCIVVAPHSTRDIEILFKLIVKVLVVGNTADTPNPPRLLPF